MTADPNLPSEVDLLVIGGGINGAGIARDAAGRGLSVVLVERDDLASHTSSWSTKLVHGGLRYLEHYEFRLVRESLKEREVLLRAAPHLVRPMRFVLPHHEGLRPSWLLRFGLFLYDHIGGRKLLPPTKTIDLSESPLGAPLKDEFDLGFEYTDCSVDDSRLTVLCAVDAAARGATIATRAEFVGGHREAGAWLCDIESEAFGKCQVRASVVVNAAGPWVSRLLDGIAGAKSMKRIRLVKGSHIVTRSLFSHDRAYIFQNADDRIVFAIPYIHGGTLIGTTDVPYEGDPAMAEASREEIAYLCDAVSEYLADDVTPADVTSTYSGVRPLYDDMSAEDAQAVTRDYAFDIDRGEDEPVTADDLRAPLLSIFGGKLTTFRKLAEHAMEKLGDDLDGKDAWTRDASLPGGEMGYEDWDTWKAGTCQRYQFLEQSLADRLCAAYGTRIDHILKDAAAMEDLGRNFGHGLTEAELGYLMNIEFAKTADDVLDRRTRLGLKFSDAEKSALAAYIGAKS